MRPLQFAAQAYRARSKPLDAQECVNMFVERSPPDAKTQVPIFMCPGLTVYVRTGAGPINGLYPFNGNLMVLSGGGLFAVDQFAGVTSIGQTNLGGVASIADNGTQMVMVDGQVGWIYQPGGLNQVTQATYAAGTTTIKVAYTGVIANGDPIKIPLDNGTTFSTTVSGTPSTAGGIATIHLAAGLPSAVTSGATCITPNTVLGQIVQPAFVAGNTVRYFDGYFVFDMGGTNQFFLSALNDGTQYDANDRASAQANSDKLKAVANYHEQLLLFGGFSIEVWYDSGNANFPFQRFDGAYIQRGAASPLGIVQEDNTVFWLGEDGIFYRLNGYTPTRISTFATEYAWAQYPTITDAVAFCVTMEGHKFIFLTFTAGNATWCYDISTGTEQPLWHKRESWGTQWV